MVHNTRTQGSGEIILRDLTGQETVSIQSKTIDLARSRMEIYPNYVMRKSTR